VSAEERPLAYVPRAVWLALAAALAGQMAWNAARPAARPAASDLPPAPSPALLRLASFGEPEAAARLAMLYLQSFDYGGANERRYRELDYARLAQWLGAILELDPRSQYPLFSAARIYAEIPDEARSRAMLEFVYREFLLDPDRRWPWLAHAALLAKHRLHDLPLALRYATAVEAKTAAPGLPRWAKQMRIFILEDMNELEAARIMIRDLLRGGRITDPAELRFLNEKLLELEARQRNVR
jgi:hypothetical protein